MEEFIRDVKQRPVLWTPESVKFCNREKRQEAWDELVDKYADDDVRTPEDRRMLCIKLQKKWKCIRDNFCRDLKRLNTYPDKEPSYGYFRQVSFLRDVVEPCTSLLKPMNPQPNDEGADEARSSSPPPQPPPKKKRARSPEAGVDEPQSILDVLKQSVRMRQSEMELGRDSDRQFLLSLLDDFKQVPLRNRIVLKSQILKLIHNAQSGHLLLTGQQQQQPQPQQQPHPLPPPPPTQQQHWIIRQPPNVLLQPQWTQPMPNIAGPIGNGSPNGSDSEGFEVFTINRGA